MNKDNKQRSKTWAGNSTKKWEISKIAIENVPSSTRGYTHQVSLPKSKLNKDNTTEHTKMDREEPTRPQLRKGESGRGVFPRAEHTAGYLVPCGDCMLLPLPPLAVGCRNSTQVICKLDQCLQTCWHDEQMEESSWS